MWKSQRTMRYDWHNDLVNLIATAKPIRMDFHLYYHLVADTFYWWWFLFVSLRPMEVWSCGFEYILHLVSVTFDRKRYPEHKTEQFDWKCVCETYPSMEQSTFLMGDGMTIKYVCEWGLHPWMVARDVRFLHIDRTNKWMYSILSII